MNNVNVQRIEQEAQAIRSDPSKAKRVNRLEAEWNVDESKPQLQAAVKYEGGQVVFECDSPTFMGGQGRRPGPMNYCIMGFTACFASTFATAAASRGVKLASMKAIGECDLDFSRAYGVGDAPMLREVRFTVQVDKGVDPRVAEALKEEALARCVGVFTLRNQIPVKATVTRA